MAKLLLNRAAFLSMDEKRPFVLRACRAWVVARASGGVPIRNPAQNFTYAQQGTTCTVIEENREAVAFHSKHMKDEA